MQPCDETIMKDYTKRALMEFIETSIKKGWVNANTGGGSRTACRQILEQVGDDDDVREVKVGDAIQQYANRYPAKLSSETLRVYQSRVQVMIDNFIAFVDDPVGYKPTSKSSDQRGPRQPGNRRATAVTVAAAPAPSLGPNIHHVVRAVATDTSMTLPFNLRPDFLAQVTIPRDMTKEEAKRLSTFIDALAIDRPA